MLTYQTPDITINPNDGKPIYQQIADGIIAAIESGELNTHIPIAGTRQLAGNLNVHRKTVVEAYERLIAQGWLFTIPNRGTFVKKRENWLTENLEDEISAGNISFTFHKFEPATRFPSPGQKHWEIRFDDGVPDPGMAYIKQFMLSYVRAFIQKVRLKKPELFENPIEHPDALNQLNRMLQTYRGFTASPDRHCFIFGNNISLYLVSQVLFEKGDIVLVENPGNPKAWEVFKRAGTEMIPVDVDENGINTDQIRQICEQETVKAVYVTPASQYPTTATLSSERRAELLRLAKEHQFAIIEADYEYEFWYGDEPAKSLIADDTNGSVIFLGCLSKMLPPFNFIGFVIGPPLFMQSLRALWASMGHQGDAVLELALLGFMKEGTLIRYARKSSNVYRERRNKVAALLDAHFGSSVNYIQPQGGLGFFILFDNEIDVDHLLTNLQKTDIFFVTPHVFSFDSKKINGLRFGFVSVPLEKIERVIKLIKMFMPKQTLRLTSVN